MKQSPTIFVVCGLIGLCLIITTYYITSFLGFCILTGLLIYEGWTLINVYPEDTISETIWRLSKRPMVPCIFGIGVGWAIATGYINNPWMLFFTGGLFGHFFFQKAE